MTYPVGFKPRTKELEDQLALWMRRVNPPVVKRGTAPTNESGTERTRRIISGMTPEQKRQFAPVVSKEFAGTVPLPEPVPNWWDIYGAGTLRGLRASVNQLGVANIGESGTVEEIPRTLPQVAETVGWAAVGSLPELKAAAIALGVPTNVAAKMTGRALLQFLKETKVPLKAEIGAISLGGELPQKAGMDIAKKLGVRFDGVQKGLGMQFTDPQTGSTTYGNTLAEVKKNLTTMRAKFKAVPEFVTGKPVTTKLYRGVSDVETVIPQRQDFGAGTYYSPQREVAESYGTVTEKEIALKNPFVVKEGSPEWNKLEKVAEAAGKKATNSYEAAEAGKKAIPAWVKKKGHDALVVERKNGDVEVILQEAGGKPPIPPKTPAPPAAVPAPDPEEQAAQDFLRILKSPSAKRAETITKNLRAREHAIRNENFGKIVEKGMSEGKDVDEVLKEASAALKNPYPIYRATAKDLFSPDFIKYLRKRIIQRIPSVEGFEIKATQKALTNALKNGSIPRTVGTKRHSAYTRLLRVFDDMPEVMDALEHPEKLVKEVEQAAKVYPPTTPLDFPRTEFGGISRPPLMNPEETLLTSPKQPLAGGKPWTPTGVTETRTEGQQVLARIKTGLIDLNKLTLDDVKRMSAGMSDAERLELYKVINAGRTTSPVLYPEGSIGKQLEMLPPSTRQKILQDLNKHGIDIIDALNLPRTFIASYDVSAPLRQGLVLYVRHPIAGTKALGKMFKALVDEKTALELEQEIFSRPNTARGLMNDLFLPRLSEKVPLTLREETRMSYLARKIPGVRASERAYITFLNDLRSQVWEQGVKAIEMAGATPNDYKQMAQFINWASGRGTIPTFARGAAPVLNATLFSPRLLFARFQLPTMLWSSSPVVRKEAAKTLAAFLGFGAGVLSVGKLMGAQLEDDPKSADFGKLQFGSTRLDFWGGYLQYIRLVDRLLTGQTKTASGNIRPMNRIDVLFQFLQSKESPLAGLVLDILRGETYAGQEMAVTAESLKQQAYSRLTPLFIQDMIDAISQEGLLGAALALPSGLGAGSVTYTNPVDRERNKVANEIYGMDYAEVGAQLGRSAQMVVDDSIPQLKQLITTEQERYAKSKTGQVDPFTQWGSQAKSVENTYMSDIQKASAEFRKTGNGVVFRDKVDQAAKSRRSGYISLNQNPNFAVVVNEMNQPLTPDKMRTMNPNDIARVQYNTMLYGDDMYDQFGNYNFDLADTKKQQFVQQFGRGALDYIEQYQGVKETAMPEEYRVLQEARKILAPYWQLTDEIWSLYPMELKLISDEIDQLETTNPAQARLVLKQYPQILRARELIARYKKLARQNNPTIDRALRIFY